MQKGTISDIFENDEFICAICTGIKGEKVSLFTQKGRIRKISKKRAYNPSKKIFDSEAPRDRMIDLLVKENSRRESLASAVDAVEIWELFSGVEEVLDLRDAAELVFDDIGDSHVSAVFRACYRDNTRFKLKGRELTLNDAEKVEKLLVKQTKEEERARWMDTVSARLRSLWKGEESASPADFETVVGWIRDVAVNGSGADHYRMVREIMEKAGLPVDDGPFRILVRMGVWDRDENLLLHRLGIPDSWSQRALEETERLVSSSIESADPSFLDRTDLTHLETFTVDHATTRDFDDALSLELLDKGRCRVGIHIAEVAAYTGMTPGLEEEARERGTSIYLPDRTIPMFPVSLSENFFSLSPGRTRLALSTMVTFDADGGIVNTWILPSTIHLAHRLTYSEVNLALQDEGRGDLRPVLEPLSKLAWMLREGRRAGGAYIVEGEELMVRVGEGRDIRLEKVERNSPAQVMVSEMMILANHVNARFSLENSLPSIYRCQPGPREELIRSERFDPIVNYRNRRFTARPFLSTSPSCHSGLGLDVYQTATSPIRRYIDLVLQRQIESFVVSGGIRYSEEELQEIINYSDMTLANAAMISASSTRYWTLACLEKKRGEEVMGLILDVFPRRCLVLLLDYLVEVDVSVPPGADVRVGEEHTFRLEKVDARRNIILIGFS